MHLVVVVINDKQKENVQKMQTHKANAAVTIPKIWIRSRTWIPHKVIKNYVMAGVHSLLSRILSLDQRKGLSTYSYSLKISSYHNLLNSSYLDYS